MPILFLKGKGSKPYPNVKFRTKITNTQFRIYMELGIFIFRRYEVSRR